MRPFVLLATRADDAVADAEYEAFRRYGGLKPDELVRVRLEAGPLEAALPGFDPTAYSGLVIGGGPFNASDPPDSKSETQRRVEAELGAVLDEALAHDVPVLGACYGVGTLGTRFGGVVDDTYAEAIGAIPVTLTDDGRADPLLAGLPTTFHAFVGHKEACAVLPPGAVLLASSPTCPVQMFRLGRNAYATQFHPELDVAGIVERIRAYRYEGYYPPAELDAVVASVEGAEVDVPPRIVARFVELFARD
ncbi:glutamine amidotransferase [Luteimicrobium xylanilyticum]|uniref:GMP synthase (Glutamine-hydrolyzing) n=1 Tax=Luteimicrobium xylanilyticum TaxID=1133546 RepID=A0A5P9Q6D5_9MICO|nr:glutamine amidotransferase [Luteimicrobium xylanilyticum]QFU96953.1 GMP synthase (glutamine-hydrolyzing) [Luteimicrobium xylanilyticum]